MVFVKKIVRQSGQTFKNMDEFDQAAAAEPPVEINAAKDSNLEDYLTSLGLAMYIDKFKEHSVDLDILQILSAEDLKELVPIIGHRAKLTSQIAMLKNIVTDAFSDKNTADILTNTNEIYLLQESDVNQGLNSDSVLMLDEQIDDQTSSSSASKEDCELYQILSSTNEGEGLLLQYQENGLLDVK